MQGFDLDFDWTYFWQLILGDIDITFLVAFAVFSYLGMVLTFTTHYGIHKRNVKRKGKKLKFKLGYWLLDNGKALITNHIAIFVVYRFGEDIQHKLHISMWLGFVVGMGIDVIIIIIRKATPWNFFQSSKEMNGE